MAVMALSTVIGVFADHDQANRAIDELRRAGYSYGRIRLVERGSGSFMDTLRGMFTGQASATSSSADDLMRMGMQEHDARTYQNELDNGRAIVIMNADDRPEQAFSIMRQAGAFDVNSHLRASPPDTPGRQTNANTPQNVNAPQQAYNPNAPAGTPNPNVPPGPPPAPNAPPPNMTNAPVGSYNPNVPPPENAS